MWYLLPFVMFSLETKERLGQQFVNGCMATKVGTNSKTRYLKYTVSSQQRLYTISFPTELRCMDL